MISDTSPTSPFVGLRPFLSHESLRFFGREDQTVELLQSLHHYHFVAVLGSSGSGKSSLVRAGLIPKLKAGFLVADRDHWEVALMKPGDRPLWNLAQALLDIQHDADGAASNGELEKTDAEAAQEYGQEEALKEKIEEEGVDGVLDFLAPLLKDRDANLLLLVDQFEELFRFGGQTEEQRDEAADFVSIMLELAWQRKLPLYVVMTMRSDFLGDCDKFYSLPEALNHSQYLVPRLTRRRLREAIIGPIRLFGREIAPSLVDRLINDASGKRDRLPVVQHALMRTWQMHAGDGPIDHDDYEAAGTTEHALSEHADLALREMSPEQKHLTRILFRLLTDTDASNRHVRRPAHRREIEEVTGASTEEINEIVTRFQSDGRSFLVMPKGDDPLIDISHESLIRQWGTLRQWVKKEAKQAGVYKRLANTAVLWQIDKAGLWGEPDLSQAQAWREKPEHNEAWARRYDPDPKAPRYNSAIEFLDASLEKQRLDKGAEQQRLQDKQTRERDLAFANIKAEEQAKVATKMKRRLALVMVLVVFAVLAAALAGWSTLVAQDALKSAEESQAQLQGALNEATTQRQIADNALVVSKAAREEAEHQKRVAVAAQNTLRSALDSLSTTLASLETAKAEADRLREEAETSKDEAVLLRGEAVKDAEVANRLREEAELAQRQTVALTLAVESQTQRELENDTLAGLLALEAFVFNKESGNAFPSEVYDALRQALNDLTSGEGGPHTEFAGSADHDWVSALMRSEKGWEPESGSNGYKYGESIEASSLDGKWTAEGMPNGDVKLSSADTTAVLRGHRGPITALAFNDEGTLLATGSGDQTVRLWSLDPFSEKSIVLQEHTSWVFAVAFGPDGKTLASGGADKTVREWKISPDGLAEELCTLFHKEGAELTSEQRERFVDIASQNQPCQ